MLGNFLIVFVNVSVCYSIKCKEKKMKKKQKKTGLNGTEAGAKWDKIFL